MKSKLTSEPNMRITGQLTKIDTNGWHQASIQRLKNVLRKCSYRLWRFMNTRRVWSALLINLCMTDPLCIDWCLNMLSGQKKTISCIVFSCTDCRFTLICTLQLWSGHFIRMSSGKLSVTSPLHIRNTCIFYWLVLYRHNYNIINCWLHGTKFTLAA